MFNYKLISLLTILLVVLIGLSAASLAINAKQQRFSSLYSSSDCSGPHCTMITTFFAWPPMLHASLSTSTHILPQVTNQTGQSGPFAANDTVTLPIDSSGEIVGHAVAFYDSPPVIFEPNGILRGVTAGLPICNLRRIFLDGIPMECTPVGIIDPSTLSKRTLPEVGDVIGTWSDSWRAYLDDGSGNFTTPTNTVACTSNAAGTSANCVAQNVIGPVRMELTRTIDNIKLNPPTNGWTLFNQGRRRTVWYATGPLTDPISARQLKWVEFTNVFDPIPPIMPVPPSSMVSSLLVNFGNLTCSDSIDNDGDGAIDCADPGCHDNDDATLSCNPNDPDENQAPRAIISAQGVRLGSTVSAEGSGSFDPDGSIVSYNWTIIAPSGTSTTQSGQNITFTGTEIGTWYIALTVTDNHGSPNTQTTTVEVFEIPIKAAITANSNIVNQPITLNGTQSTPTSEITTYKWTVTSPTGAGIPVINDQQAIATFTPPVTGLYTVMLTVTDGQGRTDTSTLALSIVASGVDPGNVEEGE